MFKPYNVAKLKDDWELNKRWQGITRPYSAEDVVRLRGSVQIEYTLARMGAERLWRLMQQENYVPALGAITGNQAVQQVQAGLKAIYVSGWQVAGDGNTAAQTYPCLLYTSLDAQRAVADLAGQDEAHLAGVEAVVDEKLRPAAGQQQRTVGAQLLRGGQGAVVDGVAVLVAQDALQRGQRGQRVVAKAVARAIFSREGQRRLFQLREVVLVHLQVGAQGGAQELLLAQVIACLLYTSRCV